MASTRPKKTTNSSSPSLGETINAVATSPAANIINLTASFVTISLLLRVIIKQWEKSPQKSGANSLQRSPESKEPYIYAVRLVFMGGNERRDSNWLTKPGGIDQLKRLIDELSQPSSKDKLLFVVFVPRHGRAIFIDVEEGAQNHPLLDEMLKRLKDDLTVK